jgi:hypothetical protein
MRLTIFISTLIVSAPCCAASVSYEEIYYEWIQNEAAPDPETTKSGNPAALQRFQIALEELIQKNQKAGELRKDELFYQVKSPMVTVPHTAKRINGDNPPCGPGRQEVASFVEKMSAGLSSAALKLDEKLKTGHFFEGLAEVVGFFITTNNTYQKDATCQNVCALLPAGLSEKDIEVEGFAWQGDASVQKIIQEAQTQKKTTAGTPYWMRLETPTLSSETIDIPLGRPEFKGTVFHKPLLEGTAATCRMRLACSTFANWSHRLDATAKIVVSFPANDASQSAKMCTDYTMVRRDKVDYLYKAVNPDDARAAADAHYRGVHR